MCFLALLGDQTDLVCAGFMILSLIYYSIHRSGSRVLLPYTFPTDLTELVLVWKQNQLSFKLLSIVKSDFLEIRSKKILGRGVSPLFLDLLTWFIQHCLFDLNSTELLFDTC